MDHRPPWLPRIPVTFTLFLITFLYSSAWLALARWGMLRQSRMLVLAVSLFVAAVIPTLALLAQATQDAEDDRHPLVVIAQDGVLLRKGNGPDWPRRLETPLNRGVEARLLFERGDWRQIELAGGCTGWVPEFGPDRYTLRLLRTSTCQATLLESKRKGPHSKRTLRAGERAMMQETLEARVARLEQQMKSSSRGECLTASLGPMTGSKQSECSGRFRLCGKWSEANEIRRKSEAQPERRDWNDNPRHRSYLHPAARQADISTALLQKLTHSSDTDIATTAITLEEQSRSWLGLIHRFTDVRRQVVYYDRFVAAFRFFTSGASFTF